MTEDRKQAAISAALAQIDAHFGRGPDTPERKRLRKQHPLSEVETPDALPAAPTGDA